MAIQPMGYTKTALNSGVEILYHSIYTGEAITLDSTAFTDGVCLAGTPIAATGAKAKTTDNASDVFGILLHDVQQSDPQGTVVIGGYINGTVASAHSGVTYDAPTKAALKNVVFM